MIDCLVWRIEKKIRDRGSMLLAYVPRMLCSLASIGQVATKAICQPGATDSTSGSAELSIEILDWQKTLAFNGRRKS